MSRLTDAVGGQMANTKELSPEERKAQKRKSRKALVELNNEMSKKDRKKFRKQTVGGVKGFKLGTNEEE